MKTVNSYILRGEHRETGDEVVVKNLKAESPEAAFAAAEKAFPMVWFFHCAPYIEEEN